MLMFSYLIAKVKPHAIDPRPSQDGVDVEPWPGSGGDGLGYLT